MLLTCCSSVEEKEIAHQKNMKQRTIPMLTTFILIAVLSGLISSKPSKSATGNYIHGTDIVTEILQAIDRREEMWRITSYLNASREELAKELPLINLGKYSCKCYFPNFLSCLLYRYHFKKIIECRWDQNQLHILRTDVYGLYGSNSPRRT